MNTEDEGSVSNGGADDKQQKDEGEVKEEDAQDKLEESDKPESSVKRPKNSSACKIGSHVYLGVSIVKSLLNVTFIKQNQCRGQCHPCPHLLMMFLWDLTHARESK